MKIVRGSGLEFVPAAHENQSEPGVLKKVLATKRDLVAGQVQMVNWSLLKVGKSFQRHYHENMQEVFVILSGNVQASVASNQSDVIEQELSTGDVLLVDAGEVHQMTNVGAEDVHYVVFGIATGEGGKTVVVEGPDEP